MALTDELLKECFQLTYVNPALAAAAAQRLVDHLADAPEAPERAWGWLHLGLAQARDQQPDEGTRSVAEARRVFEQHQVLDGLDLCDDVDALRLRVQGQPLPAYEIQQRLHDQPRAPRSAWHRYIHHNSYAITLKLLGRIDDTLQQFYIALQAAEEAENRGMLLNALGNLGGYHCDVFNFEDAESLLRRALLMALDAKAPAALVISVCNLVQTFDALRQPGEMRWLLDTLMDSRPWLRPNELERVGPWIALAYYSLGEIDEAMRWLARGSTELIGDGSSASQWAYTQALCLTRLGRPQEARAVVEDRIEQCRREGLSEQPLQSWRLLQAAADACEQLGDYECATRHLREGQQQYETLMGRSSRARLVALQVAWRTKDAERQRDLARNAQAAVERERARLAEANAALEQKIRETEALHDRLREQATRDPLTGLHNRRHLYDAAAPALALASRKGWSVMAALIDLDHFKRLNDEFGHEAGDKVLLAFADVLAQRVRKSDVVARYGGEEFVVLLLDVDETQAVRLLSELQQAFAALKLHDAQGRRIGPLNFSAGTACWPQDGATVDLLLRVADRRLYRAKETGRGRVVAA